MQNWKQTRHLHILLDLISVNKYQHLTGCLNKFIKKCKIIVFVFYIFVLLSGITDCKWFTFENRVSLMCQWCGIFCYYNAHALGGVNEVAIFMPIDEHFQ